MHPLVAAGMNTAVYIVELANDKTIWSIDAYLGEKVQVIRFCLPIPAYITGIGELLFIDRVKYIGEIFPSSGRIGKSYIDGKPTNTERGRIRQCYLRRKNIRTVMFEERERNYLLMIVEELASFWKLVRLGDRKKAKIKYWYYYSFPLKLNAKIVYSFS